MADLPDNLKAHLAELVAKQKTGRYGQRMGYKPSHGLHVVLIENETGKEDTACEGITRDDLRKLARAGMITVNTPRAAWAIRLRNAALDAAG